LLNVAGEALTTLDIVVELLIEKGVFTEHEYSHALEARYAIRDGDDVEKARGHMNPEDSEALDRFFG
jgi:hypothetical protein